ncbi:endonuclease G, mitochondrial [Drosophila santomea]|uniref:endonuclease G, mitochondrial n=1 Tax=Drosophila santomea TaxID=129105 RepID=UPI001953832A|nr:endonuclease G, mitochondrial [Drosophila santomea]
MSTYVAVALCAISGVSCFIIGALVQQHLSFRKIKSVMVSDPYVYQCRRQIFSSLAMFGRSSEKITTSAETGHSISGGLESGSSRGFSEGQDPGSVSTFDHFVLWGRTTAQKAISYMTLSVAQNGHPQEKLEHVARIMKYGFPGMDDIHVYKNFVLSYDRRNRIAHWVCEHVRDDCLMSRDQRTLNKPNAYMADTSIPATFSANMRDFKNTDWVGGHMASPQNYKCDSVKFLEAYKFSNIVPINRGLKNHIWFRLENYVREMALEYGSVHVYTGPMFMPQRITFRNWSVRYHVMGMNTVAVPTHFFKIIIREDRFNSELPIMEGYVVPNTYVDKDMDLRSFLSDIRDIEHFAGLKFCDGQQRDQLDLPVRAPSMSDLQND